MKISINVSFLLVLFLNVLVQLSGATVTCLDHDRALSELNQEKMYHRYTCEHAADLCSTHPDIRNVCPLSCGTCFNCSSFQNKNSCDTKPRFCIWTNGSCSRKCGQPPIGKQHKSGENEDTLCSNSLCTDCFEELKCGLPPVGKQFVGNYNTNTVCGTNCNGCFEDLLPRCGVSVPWDKVYATGKHANSVCDGNDCSSCFDDIRCESPPVGQKFAPGYDANTVCGWNRHTVCFEDITCGTPPPDKKFAGNNNRNTVCGINCTGCFEDFPICTCSSLGRQINSVTGDWCYLSETQGPVTCKKRNQIVYDHVWLHCIGEVDCPDKCGSPPVGKQFAGSNNADTICGTNCTGCFEDRKCGPLPPGAQYVGNINTSTVCGTNCIGCFEDIKCGLPFAGKQFVGNNNANTVCGVNCTGCFEDRKCGLPSTGKQFAGNNNADTVCGTRCTGCFEDIPTCTCSSLGRQIDAVNGDWCYLSENQEPVTCKTLDGYIYEQYLSVDCLHHGIEQVDCEIPTCECSSLGRQVDSVGGGDWCWLSENQQAVTCKTLDGINIHSEFAECLNNGVERVDCTARCGPKPADKLWVGNKNENSQCLTPACSRCFQDIPTCTCSSLGRQIDSVNGDWCYVSENQEPVTCKTLDGYIFENHSWIDCLHNGIEQIDCQIPTCTCSNAGRQTSSNGDWCWFNDNQEPVTCKTLDNHIFVNYAWAHCSYNGLDQLDCPSFVTCGLEPTGKQFVGNNNANTICGGNCTGCFEDLQKCGPAPIGKRFVGLQNADTVCGANCTGCFEDIPDCTCENNRRRIDVDGDWCYFPNSPQHTTCRTLQGDIMSSYWGRCDVVNCPGTCGGDLPDDKVYAIGKNADSPCGSDCSTCFDDIKCGLPAAGKQFAGNNNADTVCGLNCTGCFEDTLCGPKPENKLWANDKNENSPCGADCSSCFQDIFGNISINTCGSPPFGSVYKPGFYENSICGSDCLSSCFQDIATAFGNIVIPTCGALPSDSMMYRPGKSANSSCGTDLSCSSCFQDIPTCTCSSSGRQIDHQLGDWCWLSESHEMVTSCKLLDGYILRNHRKITCLLHGTGVAHIDCGISYSWGQVNWNQCPNTCDFLGGDKTGSVSCMGSDGSLADESKCDINIKPNTTVVGGCHSTRTCVTYSWSPVQWNSCSNTCGFSGGNKIGSVHCIASDNSTADESQCDINTKPDTTNYGGCPSTRPCVTYSWVVDWYPCPNTCGFPGGDKRGNRYCIASDKSSTFGCDVHARPASIEYGGCPATDPCASSCTDGIQNGNENGIDCGGDCLNACQIPTCTCASSRQNIGDSNSGDYCYLTVDRGTVTTCRTLAGNVVRDMPSLVCDAGLVDCPHYKTLIPGMMCEIYTEYLEDGAITNNIFLMPSTTNESCAEQVLNNNMNATTGEAKCSLVYTWNYRTHDCVCVRDTFACDPDDSSASDVYLAVHTGNIDNSDPDDFEYHKVQSGSCLSHGFDFITDEQECEEASISLFGHTDKINGSGYFGRSYPYACMVINGNDLSLNLGDAKGHYSNTSQMSDLIYRDCSADYICFCKSNKSSNNGKTTTNDKKVFDVTNSKNKQQEGEGEEEEGKDEEEEGKYEEEAGKGEEEEGKDEEKKGKDEEGVDYSDSAYDMGERRNLKWSRRNLSNVQERRKKL